MGTLGPWQGEWASLGILCNELDLKQLRYYCWTRSVPVDSGPIVFRHFLLCHDRPERDRFTDIAPIHTSIRQSVRLLPRGIIFTVLLLRIRPKFLLSTKICYWHRANQNKFIRQFNRYLFIYKIMYYKWVVQIHISSYWPWPKKSMAHKPKLVEYDANRLVILSAKI